ncbi:Prefoldin subunit-domain-containing protein [Paraphysoderma sedebokerense]|nr:Prefoldin subunit-domain-containing protein [Paraphysoderma sedebokerense]
MSQPQVIVNPRGIPKAPFVENVEKFLKGESPEITLKKFQETISKYKFMEASLANRKKSLDSKIPEIRKTLKMVDFLMTRKDSEEPVETQYELNDTLYATANIKYTPDVYLWLGANVMVEYPIEEAKELLTKKVNQADLKYEQTEEDLEFLREQITTMEVNIARVYNYDVKLRKEIAAKKGSDIGSK